MTSLHQILAVVVAFAAGGPADKVGRDLAEVLRKGLSKQTVRVEDVAGVGGTAPLVIQPLESWQWPTQ